MNENENLTEAFFRAVAATAGEDAAEAARNRTPVVDEHDETDWLTVDENEQIARYGTVTPRG